MIHFDNMEVNVVKVIFVVSFDGEIVTLGSNEKFRMRRLHRMHQEIHCIF